MPFRLQHDRDARSPLAESLSGVAFDSQPQRIMDIYDEVRDTVSLNEFLSQPTMTEEIEGAQRLLGVHPDQTEPRYLDFSLQIKGISQKFSIPIVEGDRDGSLTEAKAEKLAETFGAETLYHGQKVFLRAFRNQPQGTVIGDFNDIVDSH